MGKVVSRAATMLAALIFGAGLLFAVQATTAEEAYADVVETTPMYRLYNKWSTEHLFTANKSEYNKLVKKGWTGENVAWLAPTSGDPVYRLYNKWSGDHHYTTSKSEYDKCVRNGWKGENVAFYSGGNQPVYRLFNPYVKSFFHHYTAGASEYANCVYAGWKDEKVGWYGYPADLYSSESTTAVASCAYSFDVAASFLDLESVNAEEFSASSTQAEAFTDCRNLISNMTSHFTYVLVAADFIDENPALNSVYGDSFAKACKVYDNAALEWANAIDGIVTPEQVWAHRDSILSAYQRVEDTFLDLYDIVISNTKSYSTWIN